MTSHHGLSLLFVEPSGPSATEPADGRQPAADHRAEAMRRLRHPFAVPGVPVNPAR